MGIGARFRPLLTRPRGSLSLSLACGRYDKLTKKYPTVGCSAGNQFGYSLLTIEVERNVAEALKTGDFSSLAAASEKLSNEQLGKKQE